eukprot:TRINITY_DN3291_c0_g1_i3.p2 TRINITY_DN3291_c0_g1~~TRINITY_DN3291_c0_g1_i3.p2  ORF type:complete len:206 (+),score=-25.13 TRINITY_DN3291_c0_g1_i3:1097-1714(+)
MNLKILFMKQKQNQKNQQTLQTNKHRRINHTKSTKNLIKNQIYLYKRLLIQILQSKKSLWYTRLYKKLILCQNLFHQIQIQKFDLDLDLEKLNQNLKSKKSLKFKTHSPLATNLAKQTLKTLNSNQYNQYINFQPLIFLQNLPTQQLEFLYQTIIMAYIYVQSMYSLPQSECAQKFCTFNLKMTEDIWAMVTNFTAKTKQQILLC